MTTKTIDNVYDSLSEIVNLTYAKVLHKILVRTGNSTILFNKYAMVRTPTGVKVASRLSFSEANFSDAQTALVWAILDHNGKFIEGDRVIHLDATIASLDVELSLYRKHRSISDISRYVILTNKIESGERKRVHCVTEMRRHTDTARRLGLDSVQR